MTEENIAFEAARLEEYRLSVSVGEAGAPDGVTRVRVDGTGRIEAEQVLAPEQVPGGERPEGKPGVGREAAGAAVERAAVERGAVERAAGELPRERVEELLYQASLFPWGRPFPSRPGIPDEAVVEWSYETARGERVTLRMWLREAERDQAVAPALKELRRQLERISEGRIYL